MNSELVSITAAPKRMEFGAERTFCACSDCTIKCQHMPGYLIPADLDRMIPPTEDPFAWAEKNILASPGTLVAYDGRMFRIPTLVPAVRSSGACIHLTDGLLCNIHDNAPFGCAFFDCRTPPAAPHIYEGMRAVARAWKEGHLYGRLWVYLNGLGLVQRSPEVLHAQIAMAKARR